MVLEADDYVWIVKWHKEYQPDPRPKVGDIYSGLRSPSGGSFGGGGASGEWGGDGKHVLSPCQYWIKGLPGICTRFTENKCSLGYEDGATGYNGGFCDYLGRRSWCSKYESSGDNLEEYICIAPDMFRTGLGKRDTNVTTHLVLLPYPKSEILGYNEQGGVGKCDGIGMGRGLAGKGTIDLEEMYKLPVVCRHYKPWIMGFGAIEPRPMGTSVLTGGNIYDGSPSDPLFALTRYLPFAFRMYNMRAQSQKCAYWDQDFGIDFEMDYSGGYASITLPEDPLTECTCTSEASTPYKTIIDEWLPNTSDTLMDVLTPENGIICNGAKPECPCYTGKWIFCVDDNMRDGMRITAEQIMELRFWTAVWQSKEVYDSIFAERSGKSDITTSDIFTFDKWEKLGTKVEDSVMKGKRIYQCFPVPLNKREFDPDVYLTKEVITYPKATAITGTSDSEKSFFPTLVRQIDTQGFVPYLNVVYPYSRRDPWNVTPCSNTDGGEVENMEIASCNLEVPATAVFGYTIRNRTIYALNINKIKSGGFLSAFEDTKVALLSEKERVSTNKNIKDLIESSIENIKYYGYVVSGESDLYGYFGIGPLKLEYNTTTTIAIVCEYYPEEYEIAILNVDTKFYGGCIVQDTFEYKYESTDESSGYIPILPVAFGPEAKLSGHVDTFGGTVGSIFPIYNKYSYGIMYDTVHYSYCMNEYTVGGGTDRVEQWVMIGPTCYVWAELDNINLSYMFDFEVIEAHMMPQSGAQICGDSSGSNVELEVIFPKVDGSGAIKRDHILPNGVLLKAQKPFAFFNEDWSLFIKYKYRMLKDSKAVSGSATEEVVWPSDLDEEGSLNKFTSPPFSLNVEGATFEVGGLHFGTIAIMVYIIDVNGRIQSAIATKMLCDVVTTRCRPVEISYSYRSDAIGYDLIPNSGFFTWAGGAKPLAGEYGHYRKSKCGDHDCNKDNCIGPMWFPFNNCTSMDFYSWYSGAASCTMPIEEQPRSDWRYCMVDEYKAWVRTGGNWAAACGNGWYYSYSKAGTSEFVGYSKIRSSVYLPDYSFHGWTPPPFGNDGREITERWLSQEHYGFWDLSGAEPTPRSEYMPLVFDDEMLFTSFNAFDEKGRIGIVEDCLHTTCMLNYMLSNSINEQVIDDRYRFEDLFTVINHAWCMYPPPIYEGHGGSVNTRRYGFKINNVAWAWREYWKDIERSSDGATLLNFVNLNRPDYYFDCEKTEHRLITEEGMPTIAFVAPKEGESGEYTYPEIFIKGGVPRKFELIYDEYNEEQVDWVQDAPPLGSSVEGGGGEFGGAGATGGWDLEIEGDTGEGEFDTNIYEKAMGDEWFHDVNTIFDVNASAVKLDTRKIVISKDGLLGDTYAWYNRGLIANIPKNRLIHLPYEPSQVSIDAEQISNDRDKDKNEGENQDSTWTNTGIFSDDIIFNYFDGLCITKVEINGKFGIFEGRTYCKPQITISEYGMDDDDLAEDPPTVVYSSGGSSGSSFNEGVEDYNLEIRLSRSPKRILYKSKLFQIKLTLSANQHLMLNSDSGILIWSGKYVDATENIRVWEQRYIISTGDFGDKNPDGVDSKNLRSFDRNLKNAGQYFPTGPNSPYQESIKMRDKMTMVGTGEQFQEDKSLNISIGNLKTIEKEEQQKLYEEAYSKDTYDLLEYSIIIPPVVQQFADEHNMHILSSFTGGSRCNFKSEKLKFNDHEATTLFDQSASFWQPGGHYFIWGAEYSKIKCYIIGPLENIYYPMVVHNRHGEDVLPWTPYESYVGWAKLEYSKGKLDQAIALEKGIETGYDWTGPAGGFVMETFQ